MDFIFFPFCKQKAGKSLNKCYAVVWEDRLLSDGEIYPFYLLQDGKNCSIMLTWCLCELTNLPGAACACHGFLYPRLPSHHMDSYKPHIWSYKDVFHQTVIHINGSVFSALACKNNGDNTCSVPRGTPIFPGDPWSSLYFCCLCTAVNHFDGGWGSRLYRCWYNLHSCRAENVAEHQL